MTIETLQELLDVAEEMEKKLPAAPTKVQVQDTALVDLRLYIQDLRDERDKLNHDLDRALR